MILVLAGTGDGRVLAERLVAEGYRVLASAATPYGGEILRSVHGLEVREGALDRGSLLSLVRERGVKGILDATHPFAVEITKLACDVARCCGISYLRWERKPHRVAAEHPLVHPVSSWEEAAQCLAQLGVERVFLAVGVKPLEFLVTHPLLRSCHFIARVLPVPGSLETCCRLGLKPGQIVALQGAGTAKLNEALLDYFSAQAMVTKESGKEGGTAEKIASALARGIPVVLVRRPEAPVPDAARSWDDVRRWASQLEKSST